MKKIISIAIVVILAIGLGYFLFKISPQQKPGATSADFDLNNLTRLSQPAEVNADDHILGNPAAKNVMVAYEDFQCPACANFRPILESFPSALSDTKVVFRHFPLFTLHKSAIIAAYASEAAAAQNRFWEFGGLLYENQTEWDSLSDPTEKFVEYAQKAGVADLDKFRNDVAQKTYKSRVERDVREGYGLNVSGTPTLYFNGKQIQLDGLEGIKKQVEPLYIK